MLSVLHSLDLFYLPSFGGIDEFYSFQANTKTTPKVALFDGTGRNSERMLSMEINKVDRGVIIESAAIFDSVPHASL